MIRLVILLLTLSLSIRLCRRRRRRPRWMLWSFRLFTCNLLYAINVARSMRNRNSSTVESIIYIQSWSAVSKFVQCHPDSSTYHMR
jgi:hypothetical protein